MSKPKTLYVWAEEDYETALEAVACGQEDGETEEEARENDPSDTNLSLWKITIEKIPGIPS